MKKNSIYVLIIISVIAAFLYMISSEHQKESGAVAEIDSKSQVLQPIGVEGVEFGYPVQYGRYDRPKLSTTKTLGAVVFYEATESNRNFFLGKSTSQKEAPVTITLDVYENIKNLSVKELLRGDATYPVIDTTLKPVTISGKKGEYFEWDGLYRGKSVAVNHLGKTYIFSVTSITSQDKILQDFETVLKTVYFKSS